MTTHHAYAFAEQLPALQAPKWLFGGNVETLYAKSLQATPPAYRRELLPNAYGNGLVAFDFLDSSKPDAPLLLHFHGLEGSSRSHYAVALMQAAQERDWNAVVAHFPSCGGVPSEQLYHSGDTATIAHAIALMQARYPQIYAVGVSLGGNALAKYLGQCGAAQQDTGLQAAVSVSTPFNLAASSIAIASGLPLVLYTPYFLSTLLKKIPAALKKPQRIFSLTAFDDAYTAPINGFADAQDYYRRASAEEELKTIALPTLLINAKNDPFLPEKVMPTAAGISPAVQLLQPRTGGHAGFVSGAGRGHLRWLPETIFRYFDWVKAHE